LLDARIIDKAGAERKSPVNYIDPTRRYRSIWISDIHLGTRGCKADFLLDFLKHNESEYLYLVGDIVDGWRMRRSWYWAQSHNDVIQKLLRKARKGTKIFYIPGNHDEWLRDYVDLQMGGVGWWTRRSTRPPTVSAC
jgi:UDP-2,3-diacylglucosamine pyrophosphatase LpxH